MLLPIIKHKYHCWAWNRVYVKSNGRVPCWCDAGEPHTVIHKDFITSDFITDIVNSPQMRSMRLSIIKNNKLFINECEHCCCLLEQGHKKHKRYKDSEIADIQHDASQALKIMELVTNKRNWELGSIDKISEIQLEPAFPCNLKCPGCLQGWHPHPLETEDKPYMFPFEWFVHMIKCIKEHNIRLDRIAFVGRGEPTLNKEFHKMILYARKEIPELIMSMDTNANQLFRNEYLELNWINCSIDGSTKEAYDTYRRGGSFLDAITFMRFAAKHNNHQLCKIRWKYILFNTTESVELMNLAQHMACDLGIDELDFVITACGAYDGSVTVPQVMNKIDIVQQYINDNKIFQNTVVSRS